MLVGQSDAYLARSLKCPLLVLGNKKDLDGDNAVEVFWLESACSAAN